MGNEKKLGRNSPCWCGSGKKVKKCHGSGSAQPPSTPHTLASYRPSLDRDGSPRTESVLDRAGLEQLFSRHGIPVDAPGFYDHPRFLAQERRTPEFLEHYAAFVNSLEFDADYLQHARVAIDGAARFFHEKLAADGWVGACAEMTLVLCRVLERQGIWNYPVKGALRLEFDDPSLATTVLAPIVHKTNPAVVGHAWLCAPPFRIVDLTLALQPYEGAQATVLPELVLAEEPPQVAPTVLDLFDPEVVLSYREGLRRLPTESDVDPALLARARQLGTFRLELGQVRATYTCCAVSAPLEPLEDFTTLELGGVRPMRLYEQLLKTGWPAAGVCELEEEEPSNRSSVMTTGVRSVPRARRTRM